ncbi:hypothetical protein CY34DRAFT_13247 [Suillus luteus UH-Slu-Lm8-n1]|uniref:HAT C-terminal dimerisation domain-containing protein n=1 Tax=Suillus luteus UH-Slu-Lm8-n1 TaxID=930992 RepID=A0A0D0BCJ2_9AGAM|nr:hypothetical protein CY34DRAFT_13247 [Suillus luteus UH-Slu-Lm8-n1]
MEWQFLQDIEVILEAPHAARQCMSGERTPKLSSAFPAFEMFIERWKLLAQHVPHCDPLVQIGLDWADKYDERMGTTNAYAVAMFVDPSIRMSIAQMVEQEFEAYAMANLSPKTTDILAFWEVAETSFPTIFGIAMDHLPIQASAVPCERVFSSSSETDTKKRNRTSLVLMEALQVVKFLLKKERLNFTKGWAASQKDMEYKTLHEQQESNTVLTLTNSGITGDICDNLLRAIAEDECDDIDDFPTTYEL